MAKSKGGKKKKVREIVKPKTRKELRKEKKTQKKENKRNYFSSATKNKQRHVLAPSTDPSGKKDHKPPLAPPPESLNDDDEIPSDFSDEEVDAIMQSAPKKKKTEKPKSNSNARLDPAEIRRREMAKQKDLERASQKQRMKQLKLANEEEDVIISRLEKKLKINKSKDKKRTVQKMFNDGLDYALEFCMDDEEDDLKRKGKNKKSEEKEEDMGSEFGNEMGSEGDDDFGEERGAQSEDDSELSDGEEGFSEEEEEPQPKVKEDIYGRKRDAEGNIIKEDEPSTTSGKYIPPHQRAAATSSEDTSRQEKLQRLRKNCKGFLNRLSEANLHKIANSIEKLYMSHSRHDMNEALYALLSEALLTKSLCNERMVQEHIVLLAYLHASVGTEIGAHFLQMFITKFDEHLSDITEKTDVENKELNNLLLVLSYLYMFKVFEHKLLLQLIGRLGDNLCEKTVECLLLIFQSVGFKLRKDDPLAFKEMMQEIQKKIASSGMEMKENLRLKFMVDILNAVKNNNINKIPQFDPELGENLRKKLKAMLTNDKYVVTLNITIEDLLRADEVGKWWIVGSAWSGNINDINSAQKGATSGPQQETFSEKLLALAKKQRMNTDERKNIFCIIMSAEDYMDAFEKILHLALKDQRSIAYVILHCTLNEAKYNPYYAILAQKFCEYNRKYQLAFQFASWDRINDIDALNKHQVRNMAQFLLHLILKGGLALSVLKVVNFVNLNKPNFALMKDIMVGVLLASESDCRQVFEKIVKNTKLEMFKNSIRLFMQHFLLKNEASLKLDEDKMNLLRKRIEAVDKVVAYVDF